MTILKSQFRLDKEIYFVFLWNLKGIRLEFRQTDAVQLARLNDALG